LCLIAHAKEIGTKQQGISDVSLAKQRMTDPDAEYFTNMDVSLRKLWMFH